MLRKLFPQHRRTAAATPIGSIPVGERIYAVGDIHGRLDLLDALLAQVEADNASRPSAVTQIIFLGDLIDRGPQSAQVIERLRLLKQENVRLLLGNHEEVFLLALSGDIEALRFFTRIGGKETIFSYGIAPADYNSYDFPELMAALQAFVPKSHIEFLRDFEDIILIGDYAFVHAGIRPTAALDSQCTKDLRWIRSDFLDHNSPLERVIVHGHTISDNVALRPHRIGIDTGAWASGVLTAMGFEGSNRWVIQTGPLDSSI